MKKHGGKRWPDYFAYFAQIDVYPYTSFSPLERQLGPAALPRTARNSPTLPGTPGRLPDLKKQKNNNKKLTKVYTK